MYHAWVTLGRRSAARAPGVPLRCAGRRLPSERPPQISLHAAHLLEQLPLLLEPGGILKLTKVGNLAYSSCRTDGKRHDMSA